MGFIIAFAICAYFGVIAFFVHLYAENRIPGRLAFGTIFVLIALGLGALIQQMINESERGPCLAYETHTHFNAATKTMMPMRVCVERGEWVK